jgi:hypothetical protein
MGGVRHWLFECVADLDQVLIAFLGGCGGVHAAEGIRCAAACFRGASRAEAGVADVAGQVKAAGRLWPGQFIIDYSAAIRHLIFLWDQDGVEHSRPRR